MVGFSIVVHEQRLVARFVSVRTEGLIESIRACDTVAHGHAYPCGSVVAVRFFPMAPHHPFFGLRVVYDLRAFKKAALRDVVQVFTGRSVGFQGQSDALPVIQVCGGVATDAVRFEFRAILAKPIVCAIVEHHAASVGIDGSVLGIVPYFARVELGKLCRTVDMPCP